MSKLNHYIIRIDSIKQCEQYCAGLAAVKIFEVLKDLTSNYQWYLADVEYNQYNPSSPDQFPIEKPLLIGDIENLIQHARSVDQFLCGIFLGIYEKHSEFKRVISKELFDTEDPENNLEFSDIEIRAFDTSYFLVFTTRLDIVKKLISSVNLKIIGEIEYIKFDENGVKVKELIINF